MGLNKHAQTSPFLLVFWVILFFLLMGAGLGYFVTQTVGVAFSFGSLTGVEAFIIANLVLWFVLAFIMAVMWWSR
jgi:hypothetical protein